MSTGYTLEPGYQSGYSSDEDAWENLREIGLYLCEHPEHILAEAIIYGAPAELDGEKLWDYAVAYQERIDLTCVFREPKDGEKGHIYQSASGGAPARILKEHLRRAFCRLVIAKMHQRGLEVNLAVS